MSPKALRKLYDEIPATFHYAPAVTSGDHVYLSGVIVLPVGEGEEDARFAAGVEVAFQHIGEVLRGAHSSFEKVIKLRTYHVDFSGGIETFARVKDNFIQAPYPAWTAVGVIELGAGGLVEIEVIAAK